MSVRNDHMRKHRHPTQRFLVIGVNEFNLSERFAETFEARNAAEAEALAKRNRPWLVIAGVVMNDTAQLVA